MNAGNHLQHLTEGLRSSRENSLGPFLILLIFLNSILFAQPTITSFSPASGPVGTSVVITGTNFSATPINNIVYFGATKAAVTAATGTQLSVTVPIGATYQPISVMVGGLTAYSSTPFIVTFPSAGFIDVNSFAAKVEFTTGTKPYAVAMGDLDGDGKPDLAVVNHNSTSVSVFRNTGTMGAITTGSFASKVDFTTGTNPFGVVIGDLDGDGKPELAVVNFNSNTVSVFRNTSITGAITSSSFASKVDFTTGSSPFGVVVGDLDGDGKPELTVANFGSNSISVFRNTSVTGAITSSSFASKVDFITGQSPQGIAIGDLDGDGKPELAVANYLDNSVSVFRNTTVTGAITAGSFAAKVDFTAGVGSFSIVIGDLDGDSKPDLSVVNTTAGTFSVFKNTSTLGDITSGSFAAKVDFTTGANPSDPYGIAIGDLDGDGKPDLAVAHTGGNWVSVFKNTCSIGAITAGSFNANVDFVTSISPRSIAIGDLDGDGKPDMAIANQNSNSVSILRNIVSPSPPTIASFAPASGPVGTTVTITGTNFNATPSNNIVYFGATQAAVTAAGATQLSVTVPIGATYEPISVLVNELTAYSNAPFIVTFPSAGIFDVSSFAARVDFTTGGTPGNDVAIGDLDGDGKPDLAVANKSSPVVSVFRNTSATGAITTSSFAAKVDFTTGSDPRSVAIGDLDGDGKPELVVANSGSATVSVFRNTSITGAITAGSFATKVDFATGPVPSSVAIGDMDGDGKSDLIVTNTNSSTVSVFRNTSTTGALTTGSFAAKIDFNTGVNPNSLSIGDLDLDGKPDLATANYNNATVSVLRNTSTIGEITSGSFAGNVNFSAGTNPHTVAIGDLDGDGKPDLVVTNNSSNTVSVFRNTSATGAITAGSFAAKVDFATGSNLRSVAIGDMDGDGKPDLAVSNTTSVSVFKNTSATGEITSGSFAAKIDFTTGSNPFGFAFVDPFGFAIGDLDGDGKPDLAVTNQNNNNVSIFRNIVSPPIPTITSFTPASGPVGTTLTITGTNFNATPSNNIVYFGATQAAVTAASDTQLTVTVPLGATYEPISVIANNLTAYSSAPFIITFPSAGIIYQGSFAAKVDFTTGSTPNYVAIGDLDGDGKPDLAVANYGGNSVSIFRNTSATGVITSGSFTAKVDFTTGAGPRGVAIGDLDGDGKPDLAVANTSGGTVSIFRNTSATGVITSGSFTAKVDFTTASGPNDVAIGDLDGDGKPDLAVIQSSTVSVFRNTSDRGEITSGSFEARVDFTTGGVLVDVVIGDLDGDGKPDLALVNHGSNWVSMFRNTTVTGAITADSFAAMVNFTAGDAPFSIAIGDLNGDGKPDIAVANSGSNSVSVFINTSATGSITAGSFATKVDFTTGSTPNYVAIGDLDGDGKPELVVANNNSNTVSILRNTTELMPPIANTATSITQTQFNASWSASPLATDYRLDVSTSSDNFLSFVSGYNNLTVSGTSQTVTGLSPFTSYQYRVRAVNASMTSSNSNTISATTLAVVPVLSSFSPTSGPVGTSVTITGLNFSTTPASNTVYFGATKAAVISANTSQLTVTVPTGATYQPISVMVNGSTGYSSAPFIVTYPSAGIIYQGSFAGKVDFTPGTEPRSVAIGDLDGDGKPDLAVANGNSNSNTVSVFRNTSATGAITAGSFADKVDFTAGSTPFNVAIVDLDGDGKPDLAVANYASSTVSVFRNTSAGSITTGSFAAKVDFTTGTSPFNVAIGDLDGDGKPELAVTNFGSSSVSVFRNTSTTGVITASSFAAKEDFFTAGGTGPYFVAIGDLDGDGKPDLAVGNAGDNSVSVFRNTSATGSITTGSFAAKVDFTTGPNPYSVAIGDLDGDGKPELTVANNSSNSVSVFRNTSTTGSITTGSFAAKVDFTTGTNPYGIAIGDLDGDGKADFAVTNVVGNSVSVFKNNSATGAITANSFAAKVDFATGVYPKGIVIGDLDGDGKADLAVANDGSNKVSILRNTTELMPPIANPVTSITQTGFTASWNSPPGVLDYRLDVSSDNFLNFVSGYNNLTVAGTSQVVSGLSQFTSYQYRVRAVNASMTSANSNVISVTTLTVEPAVQASLITLVSKTTNSLTLNFTSGGGNSRLLVGKSGSAVDGDPIDATSYSPNSTFGSGSQIGTGNYVVGAGSSPITVSGLTPNTTYHFRVYEFNGSGGTENYNVNTSSGNPASFTTLFAEPTAQASGLIFSSVTSNSITVNFSNGNGASRLLVSKSGAPVDSNPADGITYISNNAFGNGSQLGAGNFVVGSGSAPITVTGLNPETTYHFRVFEFSGSGGTENYSTASASGNSASRSTLANEPVTQASSLALTNLTINSMDGMFAPATGAAGYVVLRKEGSPPPEVPTDETTYSVGNFGSSQVIYSGAATSFPSSGLTSATAYFYRVYAYNGAGVATNYLSVNPAEGNAMTLPVATVARPASNPTAASFTANWDPVTGAATYELDVSKDNFATFEAGFPKTGITEIEYTVISLAASTTYRYRVRSVNSAGGKSANSNNVTAVTSAPSADPLKINTAPTSSTLPVDFASTKLTVNVSGGTPPYVTVMKYRSITGNQFQSLNATFKSGNDYEVTVTESLLDQIGLEYYFEATDQITSLVKQSAHSFLYKAITTGSANTSIPFASGFNGKTASYRMFSIPYELEDKTIAGIFNELGDYDKTKWRLFRYDGIAEKYLEYQAGLPNSIELGNGYWFNAVSDLAEAIQIGTGTVKKANQAEPFTLNFVAGWNQIGNPYPFNIDWESIQTEPANENVDLGGLNLFEGGGYKDKSVLASWKGAFVFSVNGGPVSFPVTSRTTEGGRISQHDLPITLDEEIWQLPLTLSLHDLVQVSAIGMHLEAKRSKDKFDDITVPRFIDHLEMHTIHPEFFAPNFSTDMVPTGNQQDWLFTLSSNMEGPARLTWDQLEIAHSESQLILIDFTDQVWVDMKTTPHYSFSWKEGRQIKILYSRDGEINPGLSLLGQAYPNPFSNDVTIPVLVENEIAEVQVFDLLGRKVKTIGERFLTNGPHTFTWDGRDEQGNELSSGVLLYKMSGTRQVKRMIKQ